MRLTPEHRLQSWADRFIDRVVIAPMWTSGIDHAGQMTDNARSRMAARGIKFGIADHLVFQSDPLRVAFIEFKVGSNGLTSRQEGVRDALALVGVPTIEARSINDVLQGLIRAGFRLHGNAAAIAVELQARHDAAESPGSGVKKPRKSRGRVRVSQRDIQKVNAMRTWMLF